MFKRVLIANRGEVAVRVARACRELAISPVCAVSEADLGARWLGHMDEVVCIGPAPARESYLQRERVLQAALQTHCSAVHPGWGFLAEDALFAALCEQHGVSFVGPSAALIARMGRKAPARRAMEEAGLPVIPGSRSVVASADEALEAAHACGWPVILKADAGGGGRGMRRCADDAELRRAFGEAAAEAEAAFGSPALYVERFVEGGRHVEVQVLGDRFGSAVHLYERECSVQRNHQKLLEESPSPALTQEERERLGERAAAAVRALGYAGAGTLEFLRAPSGELYFMEMNARLQVEHAVTEMTTGIDIVTAQLRIAANHRLGSSQGDIRPRGHAIECRINAEDPEHGFRPSPGTLEVFEIPPDLGPGELRIDTHLGAGDEIGPHYDSLLAKVIAHAPTRDEATLTLRRALSAARIEGVKTTLALHLAVLASEEFGSGRYDTRAIPGWPARRVEVPS